MWVWPIHVRVNVKMTLITILKWYHRPILFQSHRQFANEAVLGPVSLFCSISPLTAPQSVQWHTKKTEKGFLYTYSENVPLIGFLGRHSTCTCVNIKHQWQLCSDPLALCVTHCTGRLLFGPITVLSSRNGLHPNMWVTKLAFCRVSAGTNYWCPMLLHELMHKTNPIICIHYGEESWWIWNLSLKTGRWKYGTTTHTH